MRSVVLVDQDGSAGGGFQLHGSANVIDVAVSDHNLLQRELMLLQDSEDSVDIVAGVDDHGFVRSLVGNDGAVALERADGEDFVEKSSH